MSNDAEEPKTNGIVTPGSKLTEEELEYIAALRAGAGFHLPNAKLRALAAKCQVPPEWYETEEEKPF
jgi:hypothetical protein